MKNHTGGQGAAVLRLGAAVNKSDEAKAVRTVERYTEWEEGRKEKQSEREVERLT